MDREECTEGRRGQEIKATLELLAGSNLFLRPGSQDPTLVRILPQYWCTGDYVSSTRLFWGWGAYSNHDIM